MLFNNYTLALPAKDRIQVKQQEYSNKNYQQSDILIKSEQQIHIKFSMGILRNVVCHRGITQVVNINTI